MELEYLLVFYLNGCVGSLVLIGLSKKLVNIKFTTVNFKLLSNWGINSIIILCLHRFIIEVIRLVDYKFLDYFFVKLNFFEGIVIAIIVMICLKIIIYMIPTKLYILFGKM